MKMNNDVINLLTENGEKAAYNFFNNETANLKANSKRIDVSYDDFNTNNIITNSSNNGVSDVTICGTDTKWVYELFPTLIKWKRQGANIKILLKENNDDKDHGPYRQRFLEHLGVQVRIEPNLPFKGFIFDGDDIGKAECLLLLTQEIEYEELFTSKHYYGMEDFHVIKLLWDESTSLFDKENTPVKISFEEAELEELYLNLKNVKQYHNYTVQFKYQKVDISDMIFITKYVKGFKYRQIQNLFDIYESNKIDLFKPVKLQLNNNKHTIITPPIIEKHGDNFFVLEGNTRLFYLYRQGVQSAYAVIVENVTEALPGSGRYKLNQVLISDRVIVGKDRYESFDYSKFRKIEEAIRDPGTCLL